MPEISFMKAPTANKANHIRTIPFLGRAHELAAFGSFLDINNQELPARRLLVKGDSGAGKSYFMKEALLSCLKKNGDKIFCLYIDLSNDEFQSSRLILSLLKLALVPAKPSVSYPISVPEALTVSDYHRKFAGRTAIGWNIFRGLSQAAATLVGMGNAVGVALKSIGDSSVAPDDVLANYLRWVRKQSPIILAIDNYQFMNHEIRFSVEAIIRQVGANIRLIVSDRTIDGVSEIVPPIQCISKDDTVIIINNFTTEETRDAVSSVVNADKGVIQKLSLDIFSKTKGLPKDIEFCVRRYQLASETSSEKSDVLGLLATIDRLPLMHRQFLMIASLLDGGINPLLARNVVKRTAALVDDSELDLVLSDLITLEYLKVNSESGDRLRAGHERIVQTMRELANDDFYDEVRNSLIQEFANSLESKTYPDNEAYLLHCLVGIQTASELRNNLHFISRLVRTQHRLEQFAYLVTLASEARDILPLLPENTVSLLLDSMQKNSAFERGLQLIKFVDEHDVYGMEGRSLYKYKFLVQLYQYSEAAEIASKLPDSNWTKLYRVSALLSLDRELEAIELLGDQLDRLELDEATAVLLRNTITLYSPKTAFRHLDDASTFFTGTDSEFRLATVDTNRGMARLCLRDFGEASRVLERAAKLMHGVGSREVFQALFNIALCNGLRENYKLAIEGLQQAAAIVPRALLLDQVKIQMAILVFEHLSGNATKTATVKGFEEILRRIKGVQLPYLRNSLEHNINFAKNNASSGKLVSLLKLAGRGKISMYIPLIENDVNSFIVNPSIHWRY